MRKRAVALAVVAASCSGGSADPTLESTVPSTTTTVAPSTTTSTITTSTSPPSSTTSTTLFPNGLTHTHPGFTLSYPENWSNDPDFPGTGVGFLEDHTALALPATTVAISLETQEAGFDLDAHIQRIQDDLSLFVPDFRVLQSGEQDVDGVRSVWFEYADEFNGLPIVIREQVALRETLLVTFTLISPVEFFEFDATQFEMVVESFRFT